MISGHSIGSSVLCSWVFRGEEIRCYRISRSGKDMEKSIATSRSWATSIGSLTTEANSSERGNGCLINEGSWIQRPGRRRTLPSCGRKSPTMPRRSVYELTDFLPAERTPILSPLRLGSSTKSSKIPSSRAEYVRLLPLQRCTHHYRKSRIRPSSLSIRPSYAQIRFCNHSTRKRFVSASLSWLSANQHETITPSADGTSKRAKSSVSPPAPKP